ncbi:DNA-directed RNA polymerase subunit H [Halogranum rubrum]|uniref:DNA-directed RNA polymerase subunit Rpo5 n=2 Tax=Halogranum rubrum TaxID=553466 RepID=A0A1I4FYZ2_9EURY|nr:MULTISPECIES: DNA-directed RNA polymerase subunit H [Halogranum]EJN59447.1 DNA-directed RNA polymerase subunit H [Halogranum salarium B-1]SFL22729.1 DNA-directed RNA polymerase subunit H [Halogranum rubrum]
MVDVSQHNLVPEHTVLDEPERVEEVLEEYNVEKTNLPKIKRKDPALRDTDAEVGDVIEIVRDSRTTDQAVVYRLVVE